ncbi:MAG: hypothetical protein RI945_9 [Candidatus Parcubacteria bacterium]
MIHFILSFASVAIATKLVGVYYSGYPALLIFTLILVLINGVVKPVLKLITWPINFLTLGLFHLILNVLLLMLASSLTPGFVFASFLQAAIFGLIFGILQWFFSKFDL